TSRRDHPSLRCVRRVVARHELDARWDPDARLADLGPHAGWGTVMTSPISANIRALTLTLALAFLVTSIGAAYWTVLASDQLANDPFNPRLLAATNDRPRGAIVDRNGSPVATSEKADARFIRSYKDRTLAQVVGYASPKFGLSGVEAAYADSLIGQDPADPVSIWKARYLGDRAPAGQVLLGIDLKIQKAAADALGGRKGAIVALDPRTGAILASVSVPSYDANQVVDPSKQDAAFDQLSHSPDHALLNRVAQGLYPPGSIFKVVTGAAALENGFDPTKKLRVDDPYQADKSWGDYFVRSASHAHGHFVRQIAPGPQGQVISPNTAKTLTTMLVGAVSGQGGFAFGARIPGVDVAGKTGTAENRPGEAPHGWFVGFAPASNPTIVVAVIIENTPEGGVAAAPLGAVVMRAALGK